MVWSVVEYAAGRMLSELEAVESEYRLDRLQSEDVMALVAVMWVRHHPLPSPQPSSTPSQAQVPQPE